MNHRYGIFDNDSVGFGRTGNTCYNGAGPIWIQIVASSLKIINFKFLSFIFFILFYLFCFGWIIHENQKKISILYRLETVYPHHISILLKESALGSVFVLDNNLLMNVTDLGGILAFHFPSLSNAQMLVSEF